MTKNKRKREEEAEDSQKGRTLSSLCVILDLDQTILHSCAASDVGADDAHDFCVWVDGVEYRTLLRPHALELWRWLAKEAGMFGVWTAGNKEYAYQVTEAIVAKAGVQTTRPPDFVLDRDMCKGARLVKDLSLFKRCFPCYKSVLVDDNPVHKQFNVSNVVCVAPFVRGGKDDCELRKLFDPSLLLDC
jgi:hypothetical protein